VKRIVVASNNPGKLREIRTLLQGLALTAVPQGELGIAEAAEPHDTFLENALAKARHASRASGLPALADDSGLCVEALGGEPGVHSAYFAGREGTREERDACNNDKLLRELRDDRRAYYACLIVLLRSASDPLPLIAQGIWRGAGAR
jgi:XTP/dITP diphosphohydrolase